MAGRRGGAVIAGAAEEHQVAGLELRNGGHQLFARLHVGELCLGERGKLIPARAKAYCTSPEQSKPG